jgi:hypothetical protein
MMSRVLALLAVTLGATIFAASAAPSVLTQSEVAPYLHAQRLVDVGGHRINVYCMGHGSPSVILDAGEGETMYTWRKVQPAIAKFTRVCSFDRAGMGFSGAGPLPPDANAMVTDLHTLLAHAEVSAPYVLVTPLPPAEMRAVDRAWNAGHDRLARLSSAGSNVVISHSEHFIQLDRPEVVINAVAKVVNQTKH